MGIADEVKGKLRQTPTGVFVGSIIASGEAEIGFQQVSELSHFAGVDYVGPLPADVQQFTTFSSGIMAGAKEAEAAKALVKFMTAPAAAAAYQEARHGARADLGIHQEDLDMRVWSSSAGAIALAVMAALISVFPAAQAQTADTVLVNGKVVTVDDRFSIAQALAISGGRIVKVGTTAEIEVLKGPQTRVIDLAGRTVIPGLIDNHAHWVRAAEHDELRFDGVTSRQQALKMLAERVSKTPAGGWIVVLGGWSEEQFTDEPKGFALEELDRIAPNNPVVLQAVYNHSYLNTAALVAAKIDAGTAGPAKRQDREGRQRQSDRLGARRRRRRLRRGADSACRTRRRGSRIPASSWPISTRWGSRRGSTPAGAA